mmetsp:Transcript_16636/g.40987  ORF Transcript_16636/g.40987 Transcript_16636/m.40987 type:complete len:87 (+) Transcript_16636:81-341(+)
MNRNSREQTKWKVASSCNNTMSIGIVSTAILDKVFQKILCRRVCKTQASYPQHHYPKRHILSQMHSLHTRKHDMNGNRERRERKGR